MRAERLSTDFPLVSLTLFSMTDKIACSDFSSCRTLLIGAKELRRIFLGFCVLHTFTAYPLMRFFTTQWEILPPDKGALPLLTSCTCPTSFGSIPARSMRCPRRLYRFVFDCNRVTKYLFPFFSLAIRHNRSRAKNPSSAIYTDHSGHSSIPNGLL